MCTNEEDKICGLLAEIAVATAGAAAVVTLFSSYGLNGLP